MSRFNPFAYMLDVKGSEAKGETKVGQRSGNMSRFTPFAYINLCIGGKGQRGLGNNYQRNTCHLQHFFPTCIYVGGKHTDQSHKLKLASVHAGGHSHEQEK